MKKWFKQLLSSIEEANKRNFGNGKMECCDLNQQASSERRNGGQQSEMLQRGKT